MRPASGFSFAFLVLAGCHSATAPVPTASTVDGALASAEPAPPSVADAEAGATATDDAAAPPLAMKSGDERADAGAPKEGPEGMLLVPGGKFTMGSDTIGEGDERPAHEVTIAPFWLDRTEVTQAAYDECVAAKACTPPDGAILATFGGLFRGPNKPVIGVSWFDAQKYCAWKGKRLPREAEFERAVRGDDGRKFPWGNEAPTHERTVFETNATEDVASHPSGRGPYGHDDLAGNVWEWQSDDYDPFAYRRLTASEGRPGTCEEIVAAQNELRKAGKQGFTGSNPIPNECEKNIRGGAYNYSGGGLRSTNRIHHPPRFKLRMTGLRCAKDV